MGEPSDQAAAVELWLAVGLSKADADELARALQAVIDRIRARDNDKEPHYLVHLAAVKIQAGTAEATPLSCLNCIGNSCLFGSLTHCGA